MSKKISSKFAIGAVVLFSIVIAGVIYWQKSLVDNQQMVVDASNQGETNSFQDASETQKSSSALKAKSSLMNNPNGYANFDFNFDIKYPDSWVVRATGFPDKKADEKYVITLGNKEFFKKMDGQDTLILDDEEEGEPDKVIDGIVNGGMTIIITTVKNSFQLETLECSLQDQGKTCFSHYTTINNNEAGVRALAKTYKTAGGITQGIWFIREDHLFNFFAMLIKSTDTASVRALAEETTIVDDIASTIVFQEKTRE